MRLASERETLERLIQCLKIMQLNSVPISPVDIPELNNFNISLFVKRDDLQHPIVSGNKLYKLFYHLQRCQQLGVKTLLTFGGAYSNHLHATAYAANQLGIQAVAIVRGEQIIPLNPTLKDCTDWGMILEPVSRQDYKLKQNSAGVKAVLDRYPNAYVIPEGGGDLLGVKGAQKILQGVDQSQFDYIVCPCGTGTTLSGIISKSQPHIHVVGIPVLKGANWMVEEVQTWLNKLKDDGETAGYNNWSINTEYHFGGYGKVTDELSDFIVDMERQYNLPLDPIYTAKCVYGILDLAKKGVLKQGSRILFIHTGGLQGARP